MAKPMEWDGRRLCKVELLKSNPAGELTIKVMKMERTFTRGVPEEIDPETKRSLNLRSEKKSLALTAQEANSLSDRFKVTPVEEPKPAKKDKE